MLIKHRFLLLFALLAFIGQSVAAVHVSCSSMGGEVSNVAMMQMDHSMHGMQSQNGESDSADSCCGDIACTMVQCGVSFLAIVDGDVLPHADLLSGPIINHHSRVPSSYADSLFRPPIFR